MSFFNNLKDKLKTIPILNKIISTYVRSASLIKYKKYLIKNIDLKNKYKGKRCFIVGNGPSLKTQDLSKLKNEVVFTVNWMMKSEIYNQLKPKFHVIVDKRGLSFTKDSDIGKEHLSDFKAINRKEFKPTCILNVKCINSITNLGLEEFLNIRYIFPAYEMNENFNKEIDMTRFMPMAKNVTQVAIYSAIYMGFTDIYLLGCDMTGFLENLDITNKSANDKYGHVYTETPVYSKFRKSLELDNEHMISAYSEVFKIFKAIKKYTEGNGINIINLTNGGILDVFPREKYEDICTNKK